MLFLLANLMQPTRRLIVCIKHSTNPMARWSFLGAVILLILLEVVSPLFGDRVVLTSEFGVG